MMKFLENKKTIYIILFSTMYSVVHLFFVQPYENDKIVASSIIIKDIGESKATLWSVDFPCVDENGNQSTNKTWAEEVPVFHVVGSMLYKLGLKNIQFKLYSIILSLMTIFLLYKNSKHLLKLRSISDIEILIASSFVPFIYIHASRPIPDTLALVFTLAFLLFYIKKKYLYAFVLSFLAISTKTLAVFPIFFICLADQLFNKDEPFIKKLFKNISMGFGVVSLPLWLKALEVNSIKNPFFSGVADLKHGTSANFNDLTDRKFYSRLFTWIVVRGSSPLVFGIAIKQLFKKCDYYGLVIRTVIVGHFFYILIIRNPLRDAPWYQFYFLPFYMFLFIEFLDGQKSKVRYILLGVQISLSVTFLTYNTNFSENLFHKLPYRGVLFCEFHKHIKMGH